MAKSKAGPKKPTLTNLDKIYWPKEKITKGDLIAYYKAMAPFILPYLKNRPIMLHRFPNGIKGQEFYQKDHKGPLPKGIKTCPVRHEGKIVHYLLINDLKSLLYAANLGSIDLHPFLSRNTSLDHPDWCVIDLDPHGISFDKVVEAALVLHEILDRIKVKHYCKTSGGKGLHIVIPMKGKYTFEQSRQFAELLCHMVRERLPKTTTMERGPQNRPKKAIYLDCLQNRIGQTIVAPYAVRPRAKAPVSTPLTWKEVKKSLDVQKFTILTVPKRVKKMKEIFKPVLGKGINLKKALSALKVD